MKPLIVQFFVPAKEYTDPTYNQIGVNEELYKYSVKSIKKYAETYGIDYKMISKAKIVSNFSSIGQFLERSKILCIHFSL